VTRSTALRYGLALVTTGVAIAITRSTWPMFAAAPFAPLFGAVAATTQWGGFGPALLAILIAAVGAKLAFPPTWNQVTVVVFVPIAVFASRVIAGRNKALAALQKSEAELRATIAAERQAAIDLHASEQKLRHAQKMEAVGQLVAGVAHNFNNLLTVTLGYSDLLLDRADRPAEDRRNLQEIRTATERGAALTRQLMAFGHKHEARRVRLDLNGIVADLRDMLRRVIREDLALTIDVPPAPVSILVDRDDIEQVVLNLVLNARDALPSGGEIHIEVAPERLERPSGERAPGEYARLRVRDNGTGMTPDVVAHLFEPFFTTKDVGEGTGLGLPFVHGIARQAGGFVTVDTAPGKGTTVSVYFPRAVDAAAAASLAAKTGASAAALPQPQPGPTILLVEDEPSVRNMAARALGYAGYQVLAASGPTEARTLFDQNPAIALLLTDVVMPEMYGPALAKLLVAKRPDLRVLFMSGYADAISADSAGKDGSAFLPKPFTPAELLDAVSALAGQA